ncbi:bifunctional DNA primase/polymerase [Streptomyces mexicanus]|uniref:bifunctional DNA primase/polymerase n=1 Tax=Streptomyces mexicanus TaxID=178566 RepID=UPI0036516FEC
MRVEISSKYPICSMPWPVRCKIAALRALACLLSRASSGSTASRPSDPAGAGHRQTGRLPHRGEHCPHALLRAVPETAARAVVRLPTASGTKQPGLHGANRCRNTGDCAGGHLKWEERASTDPRRITPCWETSDADIAIAAGSSSLVVVDLDVPKAKSSPDAPRACLFGGLVG